MENAEYSDVIKALVEKQNEAEKEFEEKIRQALKRNEELKMEKSRRDELYEFLLKARGEACKKLEEKLKEFEEENEYPITDFEMENDDTEEGETAIILADSTVAALGNMPPPKPVEISHPNENIELYNDPNLVIEVPLEAEEENLNQSNESPNTSNAFIDINWAGFRFSTETMQSSFDTIIDHGDLSRQLNFVENSNTKIRRMIKNVHFALRRSDLNTKDIIITQSSDNDIVKKQFLITCPVCLKKVPTMPTIKPGMEKRGNFSINHYKRHIKLKHC